MTFATGLSARRGVGSKQLGFPVVVIEVVVIRARSVRAVGCDIEQLARLSTGLKLGKVEVLDERLTMRDARTRLLIDGLRIDGLRAMLLLQPLLLLLLLLIYRGPAQPDTTRATGQSTEGRGGQLLGLLLLTSSVSIPGELQLLLLLMLRLLLLLSRFAGRLGISQPGKVLDRSRPAERCRPGELRIHADEFVEIVHREQLVSYGTIDAGDDVTLPLSGRSCGADSIFTREPPTHFAGNDAAEPVGLVVDIFIGSYRALSHATAGIIHRP